MTDDPVLRIVRDPDDAFATFIMNRPEKLNALDLELLDALDTAFRDAQRDPGIRAIILTGAGRAFTTGFDLISDDFEMDTEAWRADMSANCDRLRVIWNSEVPVIAAINGYALAGGLELAMCCDLAIAAEDAQLGEPEVRHASGPPSLMMPWTITIRHVRWLARKLARMPGPAIKFAKASINHQQETAGLTSSWQYNVETISTLHASEHGREWMRKLKEKPLKEFLKEREAPFRELDD